MKYQNLGGLIAAYASGELDPDEDYMTVDNDECFVYHDGECVWRDGGPREIIFQALELLGIPAEPA